MVCVVHQMPKAEYEVQIIAAAAGLETDVSAVPVFNILQ